MAIAEGLEVKRDRGKPTLQQMIDKMNEEHGRYESHIQAHDMRPVQVTAGIQRAGAGGGLHRLARMTLNGESHRVA